MRRNSPPLRGAVVFLASVAAMAAATDAPAQQTPGWGTIRFDNWGFYQENANDTSRWQYRARVFAPYQFANGWTFTQRFDVPFYYTNNTGSGNPDGDWKFHISDVLAEEILDSPEVARNLRLRGSVRFVFPTGQQSPFGSGVWQIAPGAGFTYRMPDLLRGVTVAPYFRYFWSVADKVETAKTVRQLNIFPTVAFALTERWALTFYTENPIVYNDVTNRWFVPIDVFLSNRLARTFEYGFGAASAIVKDDPQYNWIVYGRLTWYF